MENKDAIIEQLLKENKLLRKHIKSLEEKIQLLEEKIARLEKNSNNSSKPPSSDIVKPKRIVRKVRGKRKRGAQPGHRKMIRKLFPPEQVNQVIEYELRDKDAQDLIPLDRWRIVQQISLPEKLYTVTEHRSRKYRDPKTGRIYVAPMPESISKGGLLGADMTAAIAFMKGRCHMSYTTIQTFFEELIQIDLSRECSAKQRKKFRRRWTPRISSWLNACRMSCIWALTRPAITTKVNCSGRGVFKHLLTVCFILTHLAAAVCWSICSAKGLKVSSAVTTGALIANMPGCLTSRCSIVWPT